MEEIRLTNWYGKYTREDYGTWECIPGKGQSSSKPPLLGSMLIFRGVSHYLRSGFESRCQVVYILWDFWTKLKVPKPQVGEIQKSSTKRHLPRPQKGGALHGEVPWRCFVGWKVALCFCKNLENSGYTSLNFERSCWFVVLTDLSLYMYFFFIYFMISLFTYMLRHVFMWLFVVTAYLFVSFLSKISKSVSFV